MMIDEQKAKLEKLYRERDIIWQQGKEVRLKIEQAQKELRDLERIADKENVPPGAA